MSKVRQSMAALVLAFISLAGCDYEPRIVRDVNPVHVEEMKNALRDLWVGHIFWVRNVALFNSTNNAAARNAAEKEVAANIKQIATAIRPFYGEAASEKLFHILRIGYGAVEEYSEATIAGDKRRQDAALVHLAANADNFAMFLSRLNPYLPKETIEALMAVHGTHHVLQINQLQENGYAHVGATWPAMRQHVQIMADTLTMALVKQFPNKFS